MWGPNRCKQRIQLAVFVALLPGFYMLLMRAALGAAARATFRRALLLLALG